ncbi:hypothetical protein ACFV0R_22055 [Streptomyces sp. NPDC059578]|uniref:hypothetical protein n=1 Tax=unclassified Streptomyces TaxID=2593676 RepID=UPI00364856EB
MVKGKGPSAILACAAVLLAGGGALGYLGVTEGGGAAGPSHVELLQEADFSVDSHLAGGAEDLFFGRVLAVRGQQCLFATKYHPGHRFHTVIPVYGKQLVPNGEVPVSGVADADGDGRTTMSDRWEIAVKNQADLSAVPSEPEPTEEPADDPPVEPSPGAP